MKLSGCLLLGFCWLLSGCSEIGYYYQAVSGHLELINQKQSISELLEAPATPPLLTAKLRLILSVREYASTQLALPATYGYTSYVDLKRSYVTAIVTASQPLAFQSRRWCFLFAGCVEYRGYFAEEEAIKYAAQLALEGLDVSVGHAGAYSTLGWLNNRWIPDYFSDPVLNTFTDRSDWDIISTLIHEMAHQVVYVSGNTSFNESFAVFVEQEGLKSYLEHYKGANSLEYLNFEQESQEEAMFVEIVSQAYVALETLYQTALTEGDKLTRKQELLADLKQTWIDRKSDFKRLSYDRWFSQNLNNAHLMGMRRYHKNVAVFAKVFEEEQKNWEKFFERVKIIADSDELLQQWFPE
ncbi:MAG: aminopeptidase [SAR324 cluster bacterium]|nr:aminopeptidase [SAR324 cluster bacterium]